MVMQLRVYDKNLNFQGLIENQTSLVWHRKYFEVGKFELHAPVTDSNLALLKMGNILSYRGAKEGGVIEHMIITDKYKGGGREREIECRGRFLESYMDRRLIKQTFNFSGRVETAMRSILSNAVPIPLVQLGEDNGFTERIDFQATYKGVLDYETKLAKYSNIGFRFVPSFTDKTITFETYKGLDRSFRQTERNRVVFSDSYGNLNEAEYETNDQLYKNVVYVGGQGEGADRKVVVVGDDTLTGLDRREVFLSASDISQGEMTEAEYESALRQRGEQLLTEDVVTSSFECQTSAEGNFIYKRHYDLGDIITVRKPEWDIEVDLRVTELQETYENGALTISPTLGTPLPSVVDWSDKNG